MSVILRLPIQFLLEGELPRVCFATGSREPVRRYPVRVYTLNDDVAGGRMTHIVRIPFSRAGWWRWQCKRFRILLYFIAWFILALWVGGLASLFDVHESYVATLLFKVVTIGFFFSVEILIQRKGPPVFMKRREVAGQVRISFPQGVYAVHDAYVERLRAWEMDQAGL